MCTTFSGTSGTSSIRKIRSVDNAFITGGPAREVPESDPSTFDTRTADTEMYDHYDYKILDLIQSYKAEHAAPIRLAVLERSFWKCVEEDESLSVGKARIGERITRLYLEGLVTNRNGYALTRKGKAQWAGLLKTPA
jgi:hypothetical protein